ncbi:hypothetical protein EG68_09883 [Paragonimus skrjabini miyazakii]|uniref:DEK C-terminal domain-containing protein n=1 Tax=Paragonimus skrjabini miyazakii TaxID=59628 RepID=A0A8S9YRP6_9TREM|nr:hypothetical protein EG68_09883 [Paragonimus skrjabini miyazakii]
MEIGRKLKNGNNASKETLAKDIVVHASSIDEGDVEEIKTDGEIHVVTDSQLHETNDNRSCNSLPETPSMAHFARAQQRARTARVIVNSEAGGGSELCTVSLIIATIGKTSIKNLRPVLVIALGRLDDAAKHESSGDEEYGSAQEAKATSQSREQDQTAHKTSRRGDRTYYDRNSSIVTKQPAKTPAQPSKQADSDKDVPVASLAAFKKPTPLSRIQLKRSIVSILKVGNLKGTSLEVVLRQVFPSFPGVDLMAKKDFLNANFKEYLPQS